MPCLISRCNFNFLLHLIKSLFNQMRMNKRSTNVLSLVYATFPELISSLMFYIVSFLLTKSVSICSSSCVCVLQIGRASFCFFSSSSSAA